MLESVKFDRVLSVNSEVEGHEARNLLEKEIRPNKNWMCEKGTEKAVVILQLDKPTVLGSIHVGNAHSAFVEVLVGKAADADQHFESLLPMSVLMKPHDCKTGENKNQTRFFGREDFNEATAAKPWDRMKVVCSQPFNKYVPYGLCFLKVQGLKEDKKVNLPIRSSEEGEIKIGSFFKKKRESDGNKPLTVSEQIKQAEKESSLASHTPLSISNVSAKLGDKASSARKNPEENVKEKVSDVKKKKDDARTPEKRKDEEHSHSHKREKHKAAKEQEGEKSAKRKSPEKGDRMSKKRKAEKPKRRKKLFQELMSDVVLVISGFKNPLRQDIRLMALQMGAKYSPDWDSHCTHLVCAYENTPKFHQVKGRGKIVKKDWVEKCHKDKKRYPWRRFALDQSDCKKPESEEEICCADEGDSEEEVATSSRGGTSQDEETEANSSQKTCSNDEYNAATDDENDDGKESKPEVETSDYPMPFLPDLFSSKTFFVDPDIKARKVLERYIIAYNGTVKEAFNEDVEFYVTEKGGAPVELCRKKVPSVVAIKPSWIWEVRSKLDLVPTTPHLVK